RRYRSGRCQVGEGVRDRRLWTVDAVTHACSVTGVNEQCKQRVHHVVVQRPAPARLVSSPMEGRLLDLEEAVLSVRPCFKSISVILRILLSVPQLEPLDCTLLWVEFPDKSSLK